MSQDYVSFQAEDSAAHAARAFERYNLVSSPVVNSRGRPIGRLTVDEVMDFIRDDISEDALNAAGLQGEEDLFAPVWNSARNRWLWLSLSLLTAFVASRVIGLFEDTIAHFVALAALMPIVAAIGGNTGNQTTTLVVRGLALSQINDGNRRQLISKEMKLSVLNGLVWGSVVGLFAYIFYGNFTLTLIIAAAMILTLLLAAILGLAIPLTLQSLKRDPALGSGVLVTALTDSMGFFTFLGLAALFL
jgi:magnesium transporter